MALAEAQTLLGRFKDAYNKNDLKGADAVLGQLKVKLIQLPALPPLSQPSATAQQELQLARDALEHAVLLAIKQQDDGAMERAFTQLKVFYTDTRSSLPPSANEAQLVGLNLLRLLVANRIAEFHTELELIPPEGQAAPAIHHAIQLEQWLMEGAYNKVLAAIKQPPSDLHAAIMSQLAGTIREEVASCSERAYEKLKMKDAQRVLMLDSDRAVTDFAAQHGWRVEGGAILFGQGAGAGAGGRAKDVPPMELINNTLVYAKELERIV